MASMLTPFVIWLLCVGIAALAIGLLLKTKDTENFLDSGIRIKTCPDQTTTYITGRGDTNCCNGDIVNGECNGTTICSLSPSDKSSKGYMSCAEWITKEWAKRSDRFCAPSIPYYFGTIGRRTKDKEGCSASPCIQDGSRPQDSTRPTCKIYQTTEDEYGKADSCFNIKARDTMAIPIRTATKAIIPMEKNGVKLPALLSATFTPPNNSDGPVTCYDWDRYKINLTAQNSQNRSYYENNYKVNVLFCGASKAYYYDRTLSRENAVGLPPLPIIVNGIPNVKYVKIMGNGSQAPLNLSQLVVEQNLI